MNCSSKGICQKSDVLEKIIFNDKRISHTDSNSTITITDNDLSQINRKREETIISNRVLAIQQQCPNTKLCNKRGNRYTINQLEKNYENININGGH